ncbi:MAG: hypothetical protein KBG15_03130 [Kofleriaceae bacterium]|nr:hypothetical protein [Kofleriaceae bacterium]
MNSRFLVAFLAAAAIAGCIDGDDVPECSVSLHDQPVPRDVAACDAARGFAGRYSPVLAVRQSQLTWYFDRYRRAIAAEPLLFSNERDHESIALQTSSWTLAQRWRNGNHHTGDESFDAIVDEIGLRFDATRGNQILTDYAEFQHILGFRTDRLFAPSFLDQQLHTSGSKLVQINSDFRWPTTWIGSGPSPFGGVDTSTAVITYLHPVPNGERQLRALVTATSVQVYDLGGAPLPPGEALAATTLPWPY